MKGRRILGAGLAALIMVGGLAVLAVSGPVLLYGAHAQVTDEAAPDEVVTGFYGWYLEAIDLQAGRNPLAERSYRSSEFLSHTFVVEVDALLDSFERGGYDPFLLAQDVPDSVEVVEVDVLGDTAHVQVETSFEGHGFLVTLKRADGAWRIDDVDHSPDTIVKSFYNRYLAYIENDGGAMRNPWVDGFYRDCPELSDSFVAAVDDALASFDKGGADPILLAQDVPVKVEVSEGELVNDEVRVTVEMFWGGNPEPSGREVVLKRIDRSWQVTDVRLD